jgi:hypothetical protein
MRHKENQPMKKSLPLLIFLLVAGRAEAGSVQFSTYYPAPFGIYDRLRLPPRAALTTPCDAGTFYYETGVGLKFCDEATQAWGSLGGGVWTQSGDNIYPSDTATNPNLNVGIGTTNPSSELEVNGILTITNTLGNTLLGPVGSASFPSFCFSGSGTTGLFLPAAGTLGITTAGAERLRIDSSGNVGIGTTAPVYQLQLSTDSAAKPTTNTWTIASDERIKTGINDFTDGLSTVLKLRPRAYTYNGRGGPGYDDADTHIGFVAQEAEPVAPYLVQTGVGVIGGAEVSDFKYYQGHALPFIIVNAIKEQQKQIEGLKAENSALKNRIEILENK